MFVNGIISNIFSGFISIDCGYNGSDYPSSETKLWYTSDAAYVDTGTNDGRVSSYLVSTLSDVRSFPKGIKNCYTIKLPEQANGNKYLIRASFTYGNYDLQNKPPEFDLYLDGDHWTTIKIQNDQSAFVFAEIIHFPATAYIHVCLVNTGHGTPFISGLELRPFDDLAYQTEPGSSGSLKLFTRVDVGSIVDEGLRYPYDLYDRFWLPDVNLYDRVWLTDTSVLFITDPSWKLIKARSNDSIWGSTGYEVPNMVMATAVKPVNGSNSLNFSFVLDDWNQKLYVYMHFVEIETVKANRDFDIYLNDKLWASVNVLDEPKSIFNTVPKTNVSQLSFSIRATKNSTLPPILNAIEVYEFVELQQSPTNQSEVAKLPAVKVVKAVISIWVSFSFGCNLKSVSFVTDIEEQMGLPPVFNGLKTAVRAVRTRGTKLSFEEVVTMLNSEDIQLLQDSSPDLEKSTVLVSTQPNQMSQPMVNTTNNSQMTSITGPPQGTSVNHMPYGSTSQPMPAYNNYYPQVQSSGNNRGFSRDRGNRGSRYPREPCGICGRTNHITAYCFYNNNNGSQQQQWRGNVTPQWSSGPVTIGVPVPQNAPISQNASNYFGNYGQQFRGNTYGNSYGQQFSGQPLSHVHFTGQPVSQANSAGQSYSSMPQAYFTGIPGQCEITPGSTVFGQQGTGTSNFGQFGQFGVGEAGPILPPVGQHVPFVAFMANQTSFPPANQISFPQAYASASQPWNIKSAYRVERNWQGDPCVPRNFSWLRLKCNSTRIISLNLSSSSLSGYMNSSFSGLESLESLDLSNNNLTGQVPDFLTQLPFLKTLNLSHNNFTGSVPSALVEKWKTGSLDLRTEGNLHLRLADSCAKKKDYVVPVIASIASCLAIVVVILAIWCSLKSKKQREDIVKSNVEDEMVEKNRHFTYSELITITNNFQKVLGKGASGSVYAGHLTDGTQVAVKMLSPQSTQGPNQFRTEANKKALKPSNIGIKFSALICNGQQEVQESNPETFSLLTVGKPPVLRTHENTHIVKWVMPMVERAEIKEIVDSRLNGDFDTNCAWKVVEIAMACVEQKSIQRPAMRQVVAELRECVEMEIDRIKDRKENEVYNSESGSSFYVSHGSSVGAPSASYHPLLYLHLFQKAMAYAPPSAAEGENRSEAQQGTESLLKKSFISIDCGIRSNYTDKVTNISYTSDAGYVDTGTNYNISPDYERAGKRRLSNLRSFPEGIKNCYTIKPEQANGNEYLIRAMFTYPDDVYDRFWVPDTTRGFTIPSSEPIRAPDNGGGILSSSNYKPPSSVMATAVKPVDGSNSLNLSFAYWHQQLYVYMHFVEIETVGKDYRVFDVFLNDELRNSDTVLDQAKSYGPYTTVPETQVGQLDFSISATKNSTLPPILNAIEVYEFVELQQSPTNQSEVDAIRNIKSAYRVEKNWQGDPCVPRNYSWDDLQCNYDSNFARIILLNLSSSSLSGNMDISFSGLESLESLDLSNNNLTGPVPDFLSRLPFLKTLDLSYNSLTGPVPEFLAQLPDLEILNLTNNDLTGSVPKALSEKSSLSLSLDGNPNLCQSDTCEQTKKKKKNLNTVIIVASVVLSVVLLSAIAILWSLKRRRHTVGRTLKSKNRRFTYSEVVTITNNFQKVIGKGGFGTVYLRCLEDGTEVAVKMLSRSSSQGSEQFWTEAKLLDPCHH
ncbi:hypothetical protein Vadar_025321 [Vaccinium darrowii]|uniref:Uncharacterized protein n=1 Tax=Vaccinium darrowii TaxID=229202 RepID=A0ACB7ZNW5_9ERIC|nr:hypothetical protein Vadar_025321 [Vaccinium darrowii]